MDLKIFPNPCEYVKQTCYKVMSKSKNVKINVKLLNNSCEIIKVFGEDNLYWHDLEPHNRW